MARTGRNNRRIERCIFCGKSARDVEQLIPGPSGVYICSECVDICHSLIREDRSAPAAPHPPPMFLREIPDPKHIKSELDKYVIG